MKGPVLQPKLFDTFLGFPFHRIAFSADITKMCRCVMTDFADRCYQCILRRENINEPIVQYELKTLTYGTKLASFIATKCLTIIAADFRKSKTTSVAVHFVERGFCMDDLRAGAGTIEEALQLQQTIHTALQNAGFPLRKYHSNSSGTGKVEYLEHQLLEFQPT